MAATATIAKKTITFPATMSDKFVKDSYELRDDLNCIAFCRLSVDGNQLLKYLRQYQLISYLTYHSTTVRAHLLFLERFILRTCAYR